MYGMLLESVEHFLKEKYGEKNWHLIRLRTGIKNHVFVTHERYSDHLMLEIASAAVDVLGNETKMTSEDFIQFFGTCFVKFFSNYGYDRFIQISGRHFSDFLRGIDNLHEHMRFAYPKLMSPSFYCSEETSTGLLLHYKSKRTGFQRYVMGQIMEVASMFYDIAVEMQVLNSTSSEAGCHVVYKLNFDNLAFKPPTPDALSIQQNRDLSCEAFFHIMPFSFLVTSDMNIQMAGKALSSMLGTILVGSRVDAVFTLRRPQREFSWENIKSWNVICELVAKRPCLKNHSIEKPPLRAVKSVDKADFMVPRDTNHNVELRKILDKTEHQNGFAGLKSRRHSDLPLNGTLVTKFCGNDYSAKVFRPLHLRGQMKYLKKYDMVLFICSPMISSVEEMARTGMYISDLEMHNSSQEMVLSGIQPLPELEYARDQLLERGKMLEVNLENLDQERQRSEELLYRMMPKAVADRLRDGQKAVETCEHFDSVTIMFSYLDNFDNICASVSPMEVVSLVNKMFLNFDKLSEKHDVYKFETLGDAQYMVVNGVPVRKDRHVEPVAAMALDILDSVRELKHPTSKKSLTVSIGIHLGPVAAGLVGVKMPQYCLFGDSVNTAARLRTTSLPMRIHISQSCHESLREIGFQTEFRGRIELKGRGKMHTYWLIGRKLYSRS
ncbi:soluble guanylate cyclase 88E-like isoform X2 [Stylophora pistillata]|uniref:soluble guanylate cyclase 88E-like isoform X2 n=1 Tax=Stylophora pistillata TaxID=50429 RepID=UPI000C0506D3|nr:soluble guanylate cyclase 88E-like isoform X2 [Stylophora pistillata]